MSQGGQSARERLNALVMASREYEEQVNQVQLQIDILNQSIIATRISGETIEQLGKLPEGEEILLPLGNLAYIKAKVMDTSKVIVNVGASVNIEKKIEDAKENLDQRLEDLTKTQMQLRQALEQIIQQMEKVRNEIEKIAAQMQQGSQQGSLVGS